MLRKLLLSVIISIDIFLASVVYGSSKIKIPPLSVVIISSVSAAIFGVSAMISGLLNLIISAEIFRFISFIVLTFIGTTAVLKSLFRSFVRRLSQRGELSWKPGSAGIVIKMYLDDTAVDLDSSKTLSPLEAFTFALASALDSAAIGLSCGGFEAEHLISAIFAFFIGSAAIFLGSFIGSRISSTKHDFSWVGGAALIAFAIFDFVRV